MQTVHFGFSKQFFAYFKNEAKYYFCRLFFEKAQSQSSSIEVEIYEQYVAVCTICAAYFNFKFRDMADNR